MRTRSSSEDATTIYQQAFREELGAPFGPASWTNCSGISDTETREMTLTPPGCGGRGGPSGPRGFARSAAPGDVAATGCWTSPCRRWWPMHRAWDGPARVPGGGAIIPALRPLGGHRVRVEQGAQEGAEASGQGTPPVSR
jgi:hypothetical protein